MPPTGANPATDEHEIANSIVAAESFIFVLLICFSIDRKFRRSMMIVCFPALEDRCFCSMYLVVGITSLTRC